MKKHRGKIILLILAMIAVVVFAQSGQHGQLGKLLGNMGEPPVAEEHTE